MKNSDTLFLCLSCGEKSEHEDTRRSEKRDRNSSWSLKVIPRAMKSFFQKNIVCPSCGATSLVHLNDAATQYSMSPDELSYVFRKRDPKP